MAAHIDKPLKIGFVLDDGLDKPDGVQQYILGLGKWLRSQGHEVHYLVGQTSRRDIPNLHSLSRNIKVRFNGGNRLSVPLPAPKRQLRRLLYQERFDILHVQTPYSPMMGERLILSAGPQTAVVGTFHILPFSFVSSLGNRLLRLWCFRSLPRFDAMLSVSPVAAHFAKETFYLESKVLPNIVDYNRFHQAKPFEIYADDKVTIVFLGRLVPRKGCHLLLQAVAGLRQLSSVPDFRVIICGRGPLENSLKQYCVQKQLTDIVDFAGFVSEEDKPRYLASADIAVFPSQGGESFGIVLLEAMANGRTAVLAGDNPGYRSVMAPRPELLFDPRSPEALTKKLEYYMQHASDRKIVAAWGAKYTKNFDTATVGQQLLTVYRQALRKRNNK